MKTFVLLCLNLSPTTHGSPARESFQPTPIPVNQTVFPTSFPTKSPIPFAQCIKNTGHALTNASGTSPNLEQCFDLRWNEINNGIPLYKKKSQLTPGIEIFKYQQPKDLKTQVFAQSFKWLNDGWVIYHKKNNDYISGCPNTQTNCKLGFSAAKTANPNIDDPNLNQDWATRQSSICLSAIPASIAIIAALFCCCPINNKAFPGNLAIIACLTTQTTNLYQLIFTPTLQIPEDKQDCAICLEPMTLGQLVRKNNSCNHIFHKKCIDRWTTPLNEQNNTRNDSCPTCRNENSFDPRSYRVKGLQRSEESTPPSDTSRALSETAPDTTKTTKVATNEIELTTPV